MKLGILYICTGRYNIFWKKFYKTCEKHFILEAEKHYFVFTDAATIAYESENTRINRIFQENLGWPNNTLKRFETFLKIKEQLLNMDFLFFFNANVIFQKQILSEDFLPKNENLLACLHCGFYDKSNEFFSYDRNENSTAYIPYGIGKYYVYGGLQGGKTKAFLEAVEIMNNNIQKDLEQGIIALWHDESHWNKYILNRNDVKILSTSYLYPEGQHLPFVPIIKLLDKNYHYGFNYLRGISNTPRNNFFSTIRYYYDYIMYFYKKIKFFVKNKNILNLIRGNL